MRSFSSISFESVQPSRGVARSGESQFLQEKNIRLFFSRGYHLSGQGKVNGISPKIADGHDTARHHPRSYY